MRKRLTAVLIPLAILITVSVAVVVVNQAFQLVALAERIHPLAGDLVFWGLITAFALCIGIPLFLLATLPAPHIPPEATEGPAVERHLLRLQKRLAKNPNVTGPLSAPPDVEAALDQLDALADARTKAAAAQVFMTTAISQNGSLDALLVLGAQSKLILEVARIYYQRPTLRDMTFLYSNVAATAFIAAELEDVDLSEQIQPIVTAVLGSSVSMIPGMSAAAGLFVNSVTTGAGNAYLTLRIGLIARQYCRAVVRPERRSLRHAAAIHAAKMLGAVARDGAASVAAVIFSKPRKYFADLINVATSRASAIGDAAMSTGTSAWNALMGRRKDPEGEPDGR